MGYSYSTGRFKSSNILKKKSPTGWLPDSKTEWQTSYTCQSQGIITFKQSQYDRPTRITHKAGNASKFCSGYAQFEPLFTCSVFYSGLPDKRWNGPLNGVTVALVHINAKPLISRCYWLRATDTDIKQTTKYTKMGPGQLSRYIYSLGLDGPGIESRWGGENFPTGPDRPWGSPSLLRNCEGGEVKGKLANGVGSQHPSYYLGTWCIQHYYRWFAHLGWQ